MKNFTSLHGMREKRITFLKTNLDGERMDRLGEGFLGLTRASESTIGAVKNVVGGSVQLLFKSGERVKGGFRIIEGLGDAVDAPFSFGADVIRKGVGTKDSGGAKDAITNTGRALSHAWHDTKRPQDVIPAITDTAHALIFRPFTDGVKLARHFSNN